MELTANATVPTHTHTHTMSEMNQETYTHTYTPTDLALQALARLHEREMALTATREHAECTRLVVRRVAREIERLSGIAITTGAAGVILEEFVGDRDIGQVAWALGCQQAGSMQHGRWAGAFRLLVQTVENSAGILSTFLDEDRDTDGNCTNHAVLSAVFASWTEAIYCTVHNESDFGRCAQQQELIPGVSCPKCRDGFIRRNHGSFCDGKCSVCSAVFEEKSIAVAKPRETVKLKGGRFSNVNRSATLVVNCHGHHVRRTVLVNPFHWSAREVSGGKSELSFRCNDGHDFPALDTMVASLRAHTGRDDIKRAMAICVQNCRAVGARNRYADYDEDASDAWWTV